MGVPSGPSGDVTVLPALKGSLPPPPQHPRAPSGASVGWEEEEEEACLGARDELLVANMMLNRTLSREVGGAAMGGGDGEKWPHVVFEQDVPGGHDSKASAKRDLLVSKETY